MNHNIKRNKDVLPLYILLVTACLKWMIEGILGQPLFEVFLLGGALGLLVSKRGIKVKKVSVVWVLYITNIFFSVVFHDPSVGRIGRVLVMIEIICFMLFVKYDQQMYPQIYDFIIKLSFFYGFFMLLQLFLKERFNNMYFPMLIKNYEYVANHYYRQGYYFGLIFNPHEIACLLSVALVALILWQVVVNRFDFLRCSCCFVLFFLMLLTQKKGVIALSLISLILVMCVLFATRKHWIRIMGLFVIVSIGVLAFVYYIKTHSDSVLLYRISQFFVRLSDNQIMDSGRGVLRQFAINEFSNHKAFGIGWRKFNSLTTSIYGYDSGHEVNYDYLQWLCETGIVGFVMNIIPVLIMVRRTVLICAKYVRNEKRLRIKWSVLIAAFSQFFTVMYGFIEIPFYDILVFSIYIISCIVINAAYLQYRYMNSVGRTDSLSVA